MEQPDDPEAYLGESKKEIGRCRHQTTEGETEEGDRHPRYPTYWSWPEWQKVKMMWDLFEVRFDQGPMGHPRRKPTRLGTNMPRLRELERSPRTRAWWRGPSRRLHPGEDCEIEVMGSMGSWTEGSVGGGCQRVAGEG